jgi:HD-like signal output (HDOD) protein
VETPSVPEAPLRDRLLEEAAELPIGNQAVLWRVAALCRDPASDARDVGLEAGRDESFAALLLKLSNSAFSASAVRIGDLTTAVARLGFSLVESLAVASPGLRMLAATRDALTPARRELHRHAVRTGLAARMIAPADVDGEQALAAGLVHNLGLHVISLYEKEAFRALVDRAARGVQLRDVEEELLGFTHAELGALLAERWRYPLGLVAAIAGHDAPDAGGLAAVIQVADALVRESGVGIEAPLEVSAAVEAAARIDRDAARERLMPLLLAQDRVEARMADEEPPAGRDVSMLVTLDGLG